MNDEKEEFTEEYRERLHEEKLVNLMATIIVEKVFKDYEKENNSLFEEINRPPK